MKMTLHTIHPPSNSLCCCCKFILISTLIHNNRIIKDNIKDIIKGNIMDKLRDNFKGRVWELHKLILNDGRWFPETADVIFFSEKFVF